MSVFYYPLELNACELIGLLLLFNSLCICSCISLGDRYVAIQILSYVGILYKQTRTFLQRVAQDVFKIPPHCKEV